MLGRHVVLLDSLQQFEVNQASIGYNEERFQRPEAGTIIAHDSRVEVQADLPARARALAVQLAICNLH